MKRNSERKYRISRFSGELTYDPGEVPIARRTDDAQAKEMGALLDEAGYPFGRALSFTSPTGCDVRTHDEVVGGGHTIEVQDETINQIGKLQHAGKLADFGNTPYMSDHAKVSEPLRDNFGAGIHDGQEALPHNAKNDVWGVKGAMEKSSDSVKAVYGEPNMSAVNSVYGNADTDRDVYGDFMPENAAVRSGQRSGIHDGQEALLAGSTCGQEALPRDAENDVCGVRGDMEDEESASKEREDNDGKDGAVTVKSGDKVIKTIVIAGQIEGHVQLPQGQKATRYEELIPQLVEIEESEEIEGLLIILNTVGGDVEAGLALSEMIAGMKKPTASLVLGGGHSIGVPLAVSSKRSFIVPSATMTLHPVRVTGMVLSAPQTYVYLNNMQERIIDFTCSHCHITPERFYELMLAREEMSTDLGSVLDGKKAVEEGLIDALGTLADAIEYLKSAK